VAEIFYTGQKNTSLPTEKKTRLEIDLLVWGKHVMRLVSLVCLGTVGQVHLAAELSSQGDVRMRRAESALRNVNP
jgi:hypothetical protein